MNAFAPLFETNEYNIVYKFYFDLELTYGPIAGRYLNNNGELYNFGHSTLF